MELGNHILEDESPSISEPKRFSMKVKKGSNNDMIMSKNKLVIPSDECESEESHDEEFQSCESEVCHDE